MSGSEARPEGLKAALLAAVPALLAEGGVEAVTTRACARRLGVAPSAVFRHFRDKRALLTAFAAGALRDLGAAVDAAVARAGDDPVSRFRAAASAYLAFALADPDRFRLLFRGELLDFQSPELRSASGELDAAFGAALLEIGSRESDTALLLRASVHGLATLAIDSPLGADLPAGTERQAALMTVLRRLLPLLRG